MKRSDSSVSPARRCRPWWSCGAMAPNQIPARSEARVTSSGALPLEAPGKDQALAVAGIGEQRSVDGMGDDAHAATATGARSASAAAPPSFSTSLRSMAVAGLHGVSPPSVFRLAQRLRPDALLARRENPARIERVLQPLVDAHGGMVVEVELRGDEIHLGNMGAVAGEAPLAARLRSESSRARGRGRIARRRCGRR